jgi:hypothetical protein
VRCAALQELRPREATDFRAVPRQVVVTTMEGRRELVGRASFLKSGGAAIDPRPPRRGADGPARAGARAYRLS